MPTGSPNLNKLSQSSPRYSDPRKQKSLVDSLGKDEYLSVEAEVKVRGRRTSASRDQLRAIANDIADTSDASVSIEGKDGQGH